MIDHRLQAQSRVFAQYRTKPKFMEWIAINGDLGNEIETAFNDVSESYDIDSAGTDELDVIGRIVVQSKAFLVKRQTDAYLFGAAQFGAGQFRSGSGKEIGDLSDDNYRVVIKAKISRNTNDATLDGIIIAASEFVETNDISIIDNEDMTFTVVFGSLTPEEKTILTEFNLIPKPQGVSFAGFIDLSE